jgi:small neutral amino acid transporter SnatA (MarC family)
MQLTFIIFLFFWSLQDILYKGWVAMTITITALLSTSTIFLCDAVALRLGTTARRILRRLMHLHLLCFV